MQNFVDYDDVVVDVIFEIFQQVDVVIVVGIDCRCIIVDLGIGFFKIFEYNWQFMNVVDVF